MLPWFLKRFVLGGLKWCCCGCGRCGRGRGTDERKEGKLVEPKLYRFEEDEVEAGGGKREGTMAEGMQYGDGHGRDHGHGGDEKHIGTGTVEMVEKTSLAQREIAEEDEKGEGENVARPSGAVKGSQEHSNDIQSAKKRRDLM